jgi:YfiH family protein
MSSPTHGPVIPGIRGDILTVFQSSLLSSFSRLLPRLPLGSSEVLRHGFFTRRLEEYSPQDHDSYKNPLHGLNLSPHHQEAQYLIQNKHKVKEWFQNGKDLFILNQIHSNQVISLKSSPYDPMNHPMTGDAIVTQQKNIVIGVITADCVPLLWYDHHSHTIAASHSGWRGALHGVLENTFNHMKDLGATPATTAVVLGPSIHQGSYEVGQDVYDAIGHHNFFLKTNHKQKYLFDLNGYVIHRIKGLGISAIDQIPQNTYTDPQNFFSCRRTRHQGGSKFGCQFSGIMIDATSPPSP